MFSYLILLSLAPFHIFRIKLTDDALKSGIIRLIRTLK